MTHTRGEREGGAAADAEAAVFLSVVIPAYNEEARIGPTLARVVAYLASRPNSYEILVVDNACTDSTPQLVARFAADHPRVRLLQELQRGKGAAVRTGLLAARGEHLLFSDADLATPIEEADKLLQAIEQGADVAIGSRGLAASVLVVHQPWYRERMGRVFGALVRLIALPGIADSQCGFKLFRRPAGREIFRRLTITGWAFDAEALFLARRLGYRVAEVPIRWIDSRGSKVNPLRDPLRMLWDLIGVRLKAWQGRYQ